MVAGASGCGRVCLPGSSALRGFRYPGRRSCRALRASRWISWEACRGAGLQTRLRGQSPVPFVSPNDDPSLKQTGLETRTPTTRKRDSTPSKAMQ